MKSKLFTVGLAFVIVGALSSCKKNPCCDCSNNQGLYAGRDEVCYEDVPIAQTFDTPKDWTDYMESISCSCD